MGRVKTLSNETANTQTTPKKRGRKPKIQKIENSVLLNNDDLDENNQDEESEDVEDKEVDTPFGSLEEEALEAEICSREVEKQEGNSGGFKQFSPEEWKIILRDLYGDDEEAKRLARNMVYDALNKFVSHVTQTYYPTYIDWWKDMKQEGFCGVMIALKNYNPDKGKPTTWCFHEIIHANREYITKMVHNTTPHFQTHVSKIQEIIDKKERAGEEWQIEEIAELLGMSPVTVKHCIAIANNNKNQISIEQPVGDGDMKVKDQIMSNIPGPEEQVLEREQEREFAETLKKYLNPEERIVIAYAYGMVDGDRKSSKEIARLTGIKQQYIRGIINKAELKYKKGVIRDKKYAEERVIRTKKKNAVHMSTFPSKEMFEDDYAALTDDFFETASLWDDMNSDNGF